MYGESQTLCMVGKSCTGETPVDRWFIPNYFYPFGGGAGFPNHPQYVHYWDTWPILDPLQKKKKKKKKNLAGERRYN